MLDVEGHSCYGSMHGNTKLLIVKFPTPLLFLLLWGLPWYDLIFAPEKNPIKMLLPPASSTPLYFSPPT